MSWYKEWFDSPLYEHIYANRDEGEARRLVKWLQNIMPPEEYPKVLDLGCGRGRHAIHMAETGYTVQGIDLSKAAIDKAKKQAEERDLKHVSFRVGDMRESLDESFDAVVNLFTSFGYFDEDQENVKIVSNVSESLREKGVFMLDYLNPNVVRNSFKPKEKGQVNGIKYEIERFIEDGTINKKIQFKGSSHNEKNSYQERVKLYELEWFDRVLRNHQLNVEQVYGDYKGNKYMSGESPRMLILARKM